MTSDASGERTPRLAAIDLLRGLVMLLMALDHVRDFVSPMSTSPELIEGVGPGLFFTRWVTHFCAPTFIFLAGTSAFLYGRGRSRATLSRFLLTRGIWLVFLEVTVVFFAWLFIWPIFSGAILQVIWAIGISMVVLSGLVWLPRSVIGVFGIAMIAGHNLLSGLPIELETQEAARLGMSELSFRALVDHPWALLHVQGGFLVAGRFVFIAYPLVPWIGVMAAGYLFGAVMQLEPARRTRSVLATGVALTLAFLVVRGLDVYGNVRHWSAAESAIDTLIAFLNTEKYPPSLAFLLMTLGPALILLAWFERSRGPVADALLVFGRVPLLFYVLHIALANLAGGLYSELFGDGSRWIAALFVGTIPEVPAPLSHVYLVWILCVVILYFPCRWFARLKQRRRDWWLSYL